MEDSTGKCELCGGVFPRRAMTVHLKSCIIAGRPDKTGKAVTGFHVFIQARYLPEYWLHILIPANAKLERLESFLRDVWLECCDHLSDFRIAGVSYEAPADPDAAFWGKRRMSARLTDVLEVGTTFEYDYDFGSTTALRLKVLGEAETAARGVALIAWNEPPPVVCSRCKRHLAEVICTNVMTGMVTAGCATRAATGEEHECGDEMLLPVVNSPRAGVCGYTG